MFIALPKRKCLSSRLRTGFVGLMLAFCLSYANSLQSREQTVPSISKTEIETAASRRVVFGHQSVGRNILDGIRMLASENGVQINITKGRKAEGNAPGIYHFPVGQNGDALGKIDDFATTMSAVTFGKTDVALVKLCYVDFNSDTDALAVAKEYVAKLTKLQNEFPDTRFIAVTAPLTAIPSGPKAWVKKMLGRQASHMADNAKRKRFNDYIRQQFDKSHLFDIAAVEAETATAEDGTEIEVMRSELTFDGGHLNEKGQKLAGTALLKLLATE